MASVVQAAAGGFASTTTAVATFASPVTSGNALIVARSSYEVDEGGTARTYTITDNKGGTNGNYVAIGTQYVQPTGDYTTFWTHQWRGLANSAGGSGTAVTVTSSEAEDGVILVLEISGLGSSLTVDGTQVNNSGTDGDGLDIVIGEKTPGAAGIHLALCACLNDPARTFSPETGWTEATETVEGFISLAVMHRAAVSSTPQTAGFDLSGGTGGWAGIHVVLSDSGSPPASAIAAISQYYKRLRQG